MTELKNCPHCGSNEVEYRRARDNPRAWVLCGNCGAMCDELDTLPEADCVTAWNRRAGETIRDLAKLYAYSPTTDHLYAALMDAASTAPEAIKRAWEGGKALGAALAAPEAPTVEQAITALVTALAASKGWMRDYADSVVRDAIDRRAPEAMPEGWKFVPVKGFDELVNALARADNKGYMPDAMAEEWATFEYGDPAAPEASIYSRQPNPYAMTTAERVAWVKGHNAGWDAAKNGAEAWKDVPRTGDWVADAGGSEVK